MPETVTEKCRGCDAVIIWARTEQGKWQPFDAKPEKRFALTRDEDGRWHSKAIAVYTPHHATCPKAEDFRRPSETVRERSDLT